MRASSFLIPLLVAGCDNPSSSFEVEAPGAVSADLTLCDEVIPLERMGDRFVGVYPVNCEGSGVIKVSFADQRSVDCPIGYATHGAAQNFRFKIEDGRCI